MNCVRFVLLLVTKLQNINALVFLQAFIYVARLFVKFDDKFMFD
jgi:hypothetical protein